MTMRVSGLFSVTLALVIGASPQAPPPSAQVSGTASIGGAVVTAGDSPQPVRRAIVKLSGRADQFNYSAITDDNGRFAIGSLSAGSYTLTVSKPAYLTTTFGAKGVGLPGTPVLLRDGQAIADLRILLIRGAVVTGTIRDHAGEPAREVPVFAMRVDAVSRGAAPSSSTARLESTTNSDDTGTFRIYGLAPGTYIVGAMPRLLGSIDVGILTNAQVDAELRALQQRRNSMAPPAAAAPERGRFSYAPVFHPSATSAEHAVTLTLAAGEERRGVDVSLVLAPIATLSGIVVGADGRPSSGVALTLTRPGPQLPTVPGLTPTLSTPPGPDGIFRYANVAPGTYTLSARSTTQVVQRTSTGTTVMTGRSDLVPPGTFYWALTTVDVNGADVTGVTLQLRAAMTMTGRVVLQAASTQPPPRVTQLRLSLTPKADHGGVAMNAGGTAAAVVSASPQIDGSFELKGLTPGPYVLSAQILSGVDPKVWWLRSAIVDGRDLLDSPPEFAGSDLTNVEITLSDRHTEIAGTLETADRQPATDFVVIAFPEDRGLWTSIRRMQSTRPATDGRFVFADLPPGTYLLAALTDLDPDGWKTTDVLGPLVPAGVRVTIGEGERRTQNLRISAR